MLGFFMEESMGLIHFETVLEPVELVLCCFAPSLLNDLLHTMSPQITPPSLGQLPTARCEARSCDGMVVIVGHFY